MITNMMSTKEVADKLFNYCNQGKWDKAQEELYADHAVSIEMPGQEFPERVEGKKAILEKGKIFDAMVEEMHGITIEGPIVAGKYFTCSMIMDVTYKGRPRAKDEEVCVYKVEDGKIVSEQFFY